MSVKDNFSLMLENVDESFIRSNVHMVNNSLLARALKSVREELQLKVLRNMSVDGAEEVKSLLAGTFSDEAVESAQMEIISMAQGS